MLTDTLTIFLGLLETISKFQTVTGVLNLSLYTFHIEFVRIILPLTYSMKFSSGFNTYIPMYLELFCFQLLWTSVEVLLVDLYLKNSLNSLSLVCVRWSNFIWLSSTISNDTRSLQSQILQLVSVKLKRFSASRAHIHISTSIISTCTQSPLINPKIQ